MSTLQVPDLNRHLIHRLAEFTKKPATKPGIRGFGTPISKWRESDRPCELLWRSLRGADRFGASQGLAFSTLRFGPLRKQLGVGLPACRIWSRADGRITVATSCHQSGSRSQKASADTGICPAP